MPSDDRLLRIGELAHRVGLSPKTIRFYESLGLLQPASRTAAGYRLFTASDVDRLLFIRKAKSVGLSLDEVRDITDLRLRGEAPCAHVRSLIDRKIADIQAQIRALSELERDLISLKEESAHAPACDECVCEIIEHHSRP